MIKHFLNIEIKPRKKMTYPEYEEQAALIRWCRLAAKTIPDLIAYRFMSKDKDGFEKLYIGYTFFANPNTQKLDGKQASRHKASGSVSGIPDLTLAKARQGYHGLYIEMKAPSEKPKTIKSKGGLSEEQKARIESLREDGYRVEVCYSWIEGRDVILDYLGIK